MLHYFFPLRRFWLIKYSNTPYKHPGLILEMSRSFPIASKGEPDLVLSPKLLRCLSNTNLMAHYWILNFDLHQLIMVPQPVN